MRAMAVGTAVVMAVAVPKAPGIEVAPQRQIPGISPIGMPLAPKPLLCRILNSSLLFRPKEEVQAIASKGGKASGRVRSEEDD